MDTIQQFGLAKVAGRSRPGFFASIMGTLLTALSLGIFAQNPGSRFLNNSGSRLEPGDIVYVDSGDAIQGGFVIKVDGQTREKSVISSGGLLRLPFGVVIDAEGQIIVSDSGRLIRIDPETGGQTLIADNSMGDLGQPCGLAMERRNSIVVANLQSVMRVNPHSGQIQTACTGGSLLYPLCVAVTEREELVVLNMAFPPEIIRVHPNGVQSVISRGGLLNRPQAFAVQGDHIYITDVANSDGNFGIGRVIDVDARTGEQTIAAEGQYLSGPVGIALDNEGQLVVGDPYTVNPERADQLDGGIIRINLFTHQQDLVTRGTGSFVNPRGVAIVPNPNHQ